MQYVHLGRSGVRVSRLCLGTMNFGPHTSEPDSFGIMDQALELGINFFDSANVYGWKVGEGITEQIVGRWLAQGGGRREKIVLATKVYGRMGNWPNQSHLSAFHIKRACEASLRRLQTDHLDLYQMHHIDRDCPWEELWASHGTALPRREGALTSAAVILQAGTLHRPRNSRSHAIFSDSFRNRAFTISSNEPLSSR